VSGENIQNEQPPSNAKCELVARDRDWLELQPPNQSWDEKQSDIVRKSDQAVCDRWNAIFQRPLPESDEAFAEHTAGVYKRMRLHETSGFLVHLFDRGWWAIRFHWCGFAGLPYNFCAQKRIEPSAIATPSKTVNDLVADLRDGRYIRFSRDKKSKSVAEAKDGDVLHDVVLAQAASRGFLAAILRFNETARLKEYFRNYFYELFVKDAIGEYRGESMLENWLSVKRREFWRKSWQSAPSLVHLPILDDLLSPAPAGHDDSGECDGDQENATERLICILEELCDACYEILIARHGKSKPLFPFIADALLADTFVIHNKRFRRNETVTLPDLRKIVRFPKKQRTFDGEMSAAVKKINLALPQLKPQILERIPYIYSFTGAYDELLRMVVDAALRRRRKDHDGENSNAG
jgi:hypothetical protein